MKKKSDGDTRNFTPIRFALLCTAILLSMALLLGRVAWLQIVTPSKLVKQEDMRSLREVTTASPRGMITDREGRPLAVSVPVNAVWADPKTIISKGGVGYNERWQALASALHLSLSTLAERVNSNPAGRFIYLARQVSPQQAEWIDKLNLPGINLREESRRFYPAGHVAANLIGFTN
ncbi:peptidoglycan synthase, partial [Salmonella enterica subsp. enterica serovar Infantis]|nr:peptidoglycan synthase [Salmonella enterica subsp. enterica serovar Infantis]